MELCSVEGCEIPKRKLGMCNKHYAVDYRVKNPEKVKAYSESYKEINRKNNKVRYLRKKDELLAAQRQYYLKHPERKRVANKKWREANKEKINDKGRIYHQRNKEKINSRKREYQKSNPEIVNNIQHRRRAKLKDNGVYIVLQKELTRLYSSKCFYCGATGKITADHIVPINRGGSHGIGNLVPACDHCNKSKASKLLVEWKALNGTR